MATTTTKVENSEEENILGYLETKMSLIFGCFKGKENK